MLKEHFFDLLKTPSLLNDGNTKILEDVVKEFPFFESAHLLYTKGLQKQNSLNFSKQLRKAAIVARSRIILHDLLYNHAAEFVIESSSDHKLKSDVDTSINTEPLAPINTEKEEKIISNTTSTLNEIKVIYVNAIDSENKDKNEKQKEEKVIEEKEKYTESSKQFDIDKLNKNIEQEISRGVIQSYVESDILKTPEYNKPEDKQPLSFTDWLHKIQKESHTIQKIEPKLKEKIEGKSSSFDQKKQIIDKIIESDPGKLKLGNNKFFAANIEAKQSLLENEHLVTETLAKIYALQGNLNKAIRAYEILSLKFPQKSTYFATLIQNLRNK
ncbi:MAG: hypothetical protein ACK504_09365 [Bacteroidota bacterium]|jgi:hypothetical protein